MRKKHADESINFIYSKELRQEMTTIIPVLSLILEGWLGIEINIFL